MQIGPTSHSFISQRLRLSYVEWGDADAPPIILQHGGMDHCRSWDWVAQELMKDWRVIAPDLRGHGDSAWSPDGDYTMPTMIYDLAQLITQLNVKPLPIIAHSWGGNISTRYAGLYPQNVSKLVSIEGLGLSPQIEAEREAMGAPERIRRWIDQKRAGAGRTPKRYKTIDEALTRMKAENQYLSDEQARHLTIHGISQNEDGTLSWKFDNYVRFNPPVDLSRDEIEALWSAITCPTLLCYGADSWASNPEKDGRIVHFKNARVREFERAGHWLHHDQFDQFMQEVWAFLAA